jgi:hypothetical protein
MKQAESLGNTVKRPLFWKEGTKQSPLKSRLDDLLAAYKTKISI